MSTNGYLATATSLENDDGRDFSNDAPLPAIPGHTTSVSGQQIYGVAGRLMPYHDDLAAGSGSAQQQYFPVCPRDSGTVAGEPCTVLQWTDWGFARGLPGTFSFQAVLYHTSNAIAFQFAPGDPSGGNSATVGIQDSEARVGLQYAANQAGALPGGTAVCFYEPAFPLGGAVADLSLGVVNDEYLVQPGQQISYDVYVTNSGPSAVNGVVAGQTLPTEVSFAGDTCGGDFADGSWAVGSLPPGGQTSCTVTLDVVGSSPTPVKRLARSQRHRGRPRRRKQLQRRRHRLPGERRADPDARRGRPDGLRHAARRSRCPRPATLRLSARGQPCSLGLVLVGGRRRHRDRQREILIEQEVVDDGDLAGRRHDPCRHAVFGQPRHVASRRDAVDPVQAEAVGPAPGHDLTCRVHQLDDQPGHRCADRVPHPAGEPELHPQLEVDAGHPAADHPRDPQGL